MAFALLLRAPHDRMLSRALEQLMKEKGMADPGVIRACVELCDYLNGKVAVASESMLLLQHGGDSSSRGRVVAGEALKVLHSEEPDEAMTLLRKAEILAANTSSAHGESHVRICCQF